MYSYKWWFRHLHAGASAGAGTGVRRKIAAYSTIVPFYYLHHYTRPRLQGCAHVSMDFVIRKFKFIGLQQSCNDQPRLGLTERRTDAGARSAAKWNIGERRGLASVSKTLGTESHPRFPRFVDRGG